ncbi:hypothetical protein HELRODRAFT_192784 [Helobdella robusta]|uniref:Uncharacterized protein n=1 Tax=Helobdella robusta TaxID=6412 RepID=T1FUA4_HELRO|nr:hypothetical protein HELRODRAFT_192784 [Helobdella robusta]ESN99772.1 hypothetical protein HELRODRAFT_192784 [Helobdella robusta]
MSATATTAVTTASTSAAATSAATSTTTLTVSTTATTTTAAASVTVVTSTTTATANFLTVGTFASAATGNRSSGSADEDIENMADYLDSNFDSSFERSRRSDDSTVQLNPGNVFRVGKSVYKYIGPQYRGPVILGQQDEATNYRSMVLGRYHSDRNPYGTADSCRPSDRAAESSRPQYKGAIHPGPPAETMFRSGTDAYGAAESSRPPYREEVYCRPQDEVAGYSRRPLGVAHSDTTQYGAIASCSRWFRRITNRSPAPESHFPKPPVMTKQVARLAAEARKLQKKRAAIAARNAPVIPEPDSNIICEPRRGLASAGRFDDPDPIIRVSNVPTRWTLVKRHLRRNKLIYMGLIITLLGISLLMLFAYIAYKYHGSRMTTTTAATTTTMITTAAQQQQQLMYHILENFPTMSSF